MGRKRVPSLAVPELRKMVCQRLREYRKRAGLSQREVGDRLGISGTAVGYVEQGVRRLDIDALQALAELYGVRLRDLLDPAADGTPDCGLLLDDMARLTDRLVQRLWEGPRDRLQVALLSQATEIQQAIQKLRVMLEKRHEEEARKGESA